MTFTIPASLPSGQYLVRVEQIALHVASTFQGAQFYIGCAQVNVENGGSGIPGPLVSIPGVYTGVCVAGVSMLDGVADSVFLLQYEPGIMLNIYNLPSNFTGYQAREWYFSTHMMGKTHHFCVLAGPAVWQG